jgi:hypothetical protein
MKLSYYLLLLLLLLLLYISKKKKKKILEGVTQVGSVEEWLCRESVQPQRMGMCSQVVRQHERYMVSRCSSFSPSHAVFFAHLVL